MENDEFDCFTNHIKYLIFKRTWILLILRLYKIMKLNKIGIEIL